MSGPWTPPGGSRRRPRDPRQTRTIVLVVIGLAVVLLVHTHGITRFSFAYFAVLIPSIILHEISHGVVANALGDDTAKRAGRLTLNPIPHIDPLGSVVLPVLLVLSGSGVALGWAKPVPVNVGRLRHPRNDSVLVSLAGPATNAVLLVAVGVAWRHFASHHFFPNPFEMPWGYEFLFAAGLANIALAVFNLIPLPPLDGSAVVERLVPSRHLEGYYRVRPYGMLIMFALAVFILPSAAGFHLFSGELHLWNAVSGAHYLVG